MTETSTKKSAWKHKYRSLKRQEDRQEFENWSEDDFINHIFELRDELDTLQLKFDTLNTTKQELKSPEKAEKRLTFEDFKQDWPYSTKFVFLLSMENKPLTSMEIHKHLLKLDKQYQFYNDPKNTLSVYLRSVVKSGRIKAVKIPGFREKLFVMPEWVGEDGVLINKFKNLIKLF
ncbi:MAG: hypothetical protein Q8T03_13435 [Bacteroidota bacterium]|nr:hypothetical protein [Bacteroidota bacterium]MDP3558369.1 hypothetical protein [Bacteroidota bacterium]